MHTHHQQDVMANDIFLNAVASCGRASVTGALLLAWGGAGHTFLFCAQYHPRMHRQGQLG